ncbi:MAG: tetratricopeptide repeat protein [Actinobacteria bacterium]|nr:tetratricopeptide repeat protein [Actinomycetota bacterium]
MSANIERVNALIEVRRYDEAEQFLGDELAARPDDPHLLYLLATIRMHQGRPFEADRLLDRCLAQSPDDLQFMARKGLLCLDLRDRRAARDLARQAMQLAPDAFAARYLWAVSNLSYERYRRALSAAEWLVASYPEEPAVLSLLAAVQRQMGRQAAAEQGR